MSKKTVVVIFGVSISILLLALMIGRGYKDFLEVLRSVKPIYLFFALASSAMVYVFMGFALWEILRLLGARVKFISVIGIAFVSTTVNYFVSSMGVSGFALRAHLLDKRGISFGKSVTASVVISVLLYAVLAFFVLQGSIFLFLDTKVVNIQVMEGFAGVIILLAISVAFVVNFFTRTLRSKWTKMLFKAINHLAYFFSATIIPQEDFDHFERQLEEGVQAIKKEKHKLTIAVLYICADWIFTLLILYLGFKAVGVTVPAGSLVSGFALGMITTLIPFLPGGLGAMELTMTAVFTGLGISWHNALVACLIYRFCYYVIPACISIFVYWGLKLSESLDLADELRQEKEISAKEA